MNIPPFFHPPLPPTTPHFEPCACVGCPPLQGKKANPPPPSSFLQVFPPHSPPSDHLPTPATPFPPKKNKYSPLFIPRLLPPTSHTPRFPAYAPKVPPSPSPTNSHLCCGFYGGTLHPQKHRQQRKNPSVFPCFAKKVYFIFLICLFFIFPADDLALLFLEYATLGMGVSHVCLA